MSLSFEIGDVILYKNSKGVYQNGVISKEEEQDGSYSIYLLNTSGKKIFGVSREKLMYQFESSDFVEEMPDLTARKIMEHLNVRCME
jgi:hypothetical protein